VGLEVEGVRGDGHWFDGDEGHGFAGGCVGGEVDEVGVAWGGGEGCVAVWPVEGDGAGVAGEGVVGGQWCGWVEVGESACEGIARGGACGDAGGALIAKADGGGEFEQACLVVGLLAWEVGVDADAAGEGGGAGVGECELDVEGVWCEFVACDGGEGPGPVDVFVLAGVEGEACGGRGAVEDGEGAFAHVAVDCVAVAGVGCEGDGFAEVVKASVCDAVAPGCHEEAGGVGAWVFAWDVACDDGEPAEAGVEGLEVDEAGAEGLVDACAEVVVVEEDGGGGHGDEVIGRGWVGREVGCSWWGARRGGWWYPKGGFRGVGVDGVKLGLIRVDQRCVGLSAYGGTLMSTSQQQAEVVGGKIAAGQTFSAADQLQLVTFGLGSEEFAVDILAVQEINRMMALTRVPQSPPEVEGVINLRGKIIPVVDLRKRFGLPATDKSEQSRIVVVEVHARTIGFIVDRVSEVLRISGKIVEPAPSMVCSVDADFIAGVGKLEDRLLILLDLGRLFSVEQIEAAKAA